MAKNARLAPLKVRVVGGMLKIDIGICTLVDAYTRSDHAWNLVNPRASGNFKPEDVLAIRALGFARDVVGELTAEAEDGSTPLTRALDAACAEAVEQGSEHVVDTREEA